MYILKCSLKSCDHLYLKVQNLVVDALNGTHIEDGAFHVALDWININTVFKWSQLLPNSSRERQLFQLVTGAGIDTG